MKTISSSAGDDEGGDHAGQAGVPEGGGVEVGVAGGALAEGERGHEANRGDDPEEGDVQVAELKEGGVQEGIRRLRKPTRGAVRRSAGEPVLRRRDPAVAL